jgi:hypothetical protein
MTMAGAILDDSEYVWRHAAQWPANPSCIPRDLCPYCRRWYMARHDVPADYNEKLGRPCPICPDDTRAEVPSMASQVMRYLAQAVVPGPHACPHVRANYARVREWARSGAYLGE